MYGSTSRGQVRSENEDAYCLSPNVGLAVVCDGLGGHLAGEHASRFASAVISDQVADASVQTAPVDVLSEAIITAHDAVSEAGAANPKYCGMGTTVVSALLRGRRATIAHVGDSRAYRIRVGGDIELLTRDHNMRSALLEAGLREDQLGQGRSLERLTQALGVTQTVRPSVRALDCQRGDVLLLCSDGLTNMLDDDTIGIILEIHARRGWIPRAADALVTAANAAGGDDNITAVVLRVL